MDDWGNVTAPPYLLASRGARFVAALLNGVVAAVPLIVGWALDPSKFHAAANGSVGAYSGASANARFSGVTVIGWLLVLLVNGILLARRGQSIGKLALGIEIVQTDGSRASFWRLGLLRWLLGAVITAVFGFYWVIDVLFIVRDDRRCLHDLIAGTVVVVRAPRDEWPSVTTPVPPLLEAVRPVARCSNCSVDNPGDSVYCSNCGSRLDPVPVGTGADAPPPPDDLREHETFQW